MADQRPLQGRKLGDRRVVVDRPHARYFRYLGPGVLEAKLEAQAPRTGYQRRMATLRALLFGRPLSSAADLTERLPKWKALPVFSSDVMSSVAYGTGAMMLTLAVAGQDSFKYVIPLSLIVVTLLVIVTFSYRQTIRAYPNGGGSYIVAHANLGVLAGLVAAGSLLTDYVLTVAVSVSSGVQALYSAFPALEPVKVSLIAASILLVMVVNLRGLRESGTLFASPTYIFIGTMLLMITLGVLRSVTGQLPQVDHVEKLSGIPMAGLGLFLVCRAFADGCSAMTGTEAVANGVPAFKPVEWKNAQQTMIMMATLLGIMFLGTSYLAVNVGAHPAGLNASGETVLSQIGRTVFGNGSPLYYVLSMSTMGILVLAAQTSFADFPRLSSILARDGFFPRQFSLRGERLAFNSGIVALALVSIFLVIIYNGSADALIGLYAIGVFTSFTLSQSGMVRHWFSERGAGWRRSALINGVGAVVTAIVVVVIGFSKFAQGVWMIIIVVPILVLLMLFIKHEYDAEGLGLDVQPDIVFGPPHRRQRVVVAAQAMSRAVVQAVKVGETMGEEVQLVHVTLDPAEGEHFRERVEKQLPGVRVVLVESPYRALVRPFVRYLEVSQAEDPGRLTVVLLPEHLPRHWWDRVLYNSNVHRIRAALVGRKDFVVLDTPYRRGV
ncbi:MAG: APC family permease [Candidatus Limnocylindrales bacterium]|jgi:amino acid transporter